MSHSNKKIKRVHTDLASYSYATNQYKGFKPHKLNRYGSSNRYNLAIGKLSFFKAATFKKTTFISTLTVLSMAMSTIGYAASPNGLSPSSLAPNELAPNEQVKEQQQVWQDKIQQQRIDTLRQSQSADATDVDETINTKTAINAQVTLDNKAQSNKEATTSCLTVQQITLGEMPELDRSVQTQLRIQAQQLSQQVAEQQQNTQEAAVQASCISVSNANELVRQITKAYLDAGYFKITIAPETVESDLINNDLAHSNVANNLSSIWHIHVATIESIDNQTNLPTQRLFGDIVDKPANIAWLDQAVSNGERLIDGRLLLDIYPVGNDVRIKVSQQGDIDTLSGDAEWRYDPDDSYGHNQITLHTTLRNVLGQADVTSLSLQQSLTDKYSYDDDNQRRSASLYTTIPNGRWQWSGLLAASDNEVTTVLPNSILKQAGDSWQASVRGDFTLKRDQDSIITLYGQIAHQDVTSEILGSEIDNQSPTLSSGRLGASYTKLFNKRSPSNPNKTTSGAWVFDLSAEKAFGSHDNPATEAGLSDDYWRWLLSGYFTHQHSIIKDDKNIGYWQMTHELQGQYSDDNLFGVTRQSLGSTYSGVRGIENAYNAASSGVTLRNTLSYEPLQSSWKTFGSQAGSQIGSHKVRWSPYVGVDYGVVKYVDSIEGDDTSDAASGTIGLKLTSYDIKGLALDRRWQLDVSASRARVDYADQQINKKQDTEISAAWQWYF